MFWSNSKQLATICFDCDAQLMYYNVTQNVMYVSFNLFLKYVLSHCSKTFFIPLLSPPRYKPPPPIYKPTQNPL